MFHILYILRRCVPLNVLPFSFWWIHIEGCQVSNIFLYIYSYIWKKVLYIPIYIPIFGRQSYLYIFLYLEESPIYTCIYSYIWKKVLYILIYIPIFGRQSHLYLYSYISGLARNVEFLFKTKVVNFKQIRE